MTAESNLSLPTRQKQRLVREEVEILMLSYPLDMGLPLVLALVPGTIYELLLAT